MRAASPPVDIKTEPECSIAIPGGAGARERAIVSRYHGTVPANDTTAHAADPQPRMLNSSRSPAAASSFSSSNLPRPAGPPGAVRSLSESAAAPADGSTAVADSRARGGGGGRRASAVETATPMTPMTPTTPPPPWSELKTKAGKERKRLPLACIACRRKKIRCSGEKPACDHCERSGGPCVYKLSSRRAAPRTNYAALLDRRLRRAVGGGGGGDRGMVDISLKSDPDMAAEPQQGSSAAAPNSAHDDAAGARPARRKRGAEEAFGLNLAYWARGARAGCAGRGGGGGGGGGSKPGSVDTAGSRLPRGRPDEPFLDGADALPPREMQEHLAEVYFDHVYGQPFPLLHKRTFMDKLRTDRLPRVLILSVCAVSARFSTHLGLSASPNFRRGEEWASPARDVCLGWHDRPNITIVSCLVLLSLHAFGTGHGARSWSLAGQAIRAAYALRLHREAEAEAGAETEAEARGGSGSAGFVESETRRRVMWACFLLDRLVSSAADRPMFISADSLEIQLPVAEQYFRFTRPSARSETLAGINGRGRGGCGRSPSTGPGESAGAGGGAMAYLVRSFALWGKLIRYSAQSGRECGRERGPDLIWSGESEHARLSREIDQLLASLPEPLRYSRENLKIFDADKTASQFVLLHVSLQHNVLLLSRHALMAGSGGGGGADADADCELGNGERKEENSRGAAGEMPDWRRCRFMSDAGARLLSASGRISEIIHDAEPHHVSAPFVGHSAFCSASAHILGAFSGHAATEEISKHNLSVNIRFLHRMRRYWAVFGVLTENLRELYRRWADMPRGEPVKDAAEMHARVAAWARDLPDPQPGDWIENVEAGGGGGIDCVGGRARGARGTGEEIRTAATAEGVLTIIGSPAEHMAATTMGGGEQVVETGADMQCILSRMSAEQQQSQQQQQQQLRLPQWPQGGGGPRQQSIRLDTGFAGMSAVWASQSTSPASFTPPTTTPLSHYAPSASSFLASPTSPGGAMGSDTRSYGYQQQHHQQQHQHQQRWQHGGSLYPERAMEGSRCGCGICQGSAAGGGTGGGIDTSMDLDMSGVGAWGGGGDGGAAAAAAADGVWMGGHGWLIGAAGSAGSAGAGEGEQQRRRQQQQQQSVGAGVTDLDMSMGMGMEAETEIGGDADAMGMGIAMGMGMQWGWFQGGGGGGGFNV